MHLPPMDPGCPLEQFTRFSDRRRPSGTSTTRDLAAPDRTDGNLFTSRRRDPSRDRTADDDQNLFRRLTGLLDEKSRVRHLPRVTDIARKIVRMQHIIRRRVPGSARLTAALLAITVSTASEAIADDLFDACYKHQNDSPPPSEDFVKSHAQLLKDTPGLAIAWHLGAPFGMQEGKTAPIIGAALEGDQLIIRYDWKDGVLTLKPTSADLDAIKVRYQGTWTQHDGSGCFKVDLPRATIWKGVLDYKPPEGQPSIPTFATGISFKGSDTSAGWPTEIVR